MKFWNTAFLGLFWFAFTIKVTAQTFPAQPFKHAITCSVGPYPTIILSFAFNGGDRQKFYPIALISYKRTISKRWKYGLTGAYEPSKRWYSYAAPLGQPSKPTIVYYSRAFTIAAEGSLNYLTTPHFTFYGTGGFGFSYSKKTPKIAEITKDESFFLNGQFTPFGFRFGKKLGVCAEFGIGYKGLLNAGLDYSF